MNDNHDVLFATVALAGWTTTEVTRHTLHTSPLKTYYRLWDPHGNLWGTYQTRYEAALVAKGQLPQTPGRGALPDAAMAETALPPR